MRYSLDYWLPDPMYRSRLQLAMSYLLKYTLTQLAFLEIFRSTMFFAFILLILINRLEGIFRMISTFQLNPSEFCKLYKPLFIGYRGIITVLEYETNAIISLYFLGIVSLSWICIKLSEKEVGYLLYGWFVTLDISALVLGIAVLTQVCKMSDSAVAVLESYKTESKVMYRSTPCKTNRIVQLDTNCLGRIRLNYFLIGDLGGEFLNCFLYMLVLRTFDAILIVSK